MTVYVGIDPSLAGTAIAVIHQDRITVNRLATTGHKADTLDQRMQRLDAIERWLFDHLDGLPGTTAIIGIEGPAYAAQAQAGVHLRAGLWWALARRARHWGQLVEIAPTIRAKYATGKGNAPKDAVLLAVSRRYPLFTGTTNDEADALIVAAILARLDGHPIDDLPATHLAALNTLQEHP